MSGLLLHSAPWIVPVTGPILIDGGVVVEQGNIVAVDVLPALQQMFPHVETIRYPHTALTPALINTHIHLELSHLAQLAAKPLSTTFTGWIVQLLNLRDRLGAVGPTAESAALATAQRQHQQGVSVIMDIGNTAIGQSLTAQTPGRIVACKEYLGLAASTLDKSLQRLQAESDTTCCSAHAPYSTHPRLIQALKERARALDHVFPIHVAEPVAEGEMLSQGRGEMVDFIRSRGFWDGSFVPPGTFGSLRYLYDLGVLDQQTLAVHAVHVHQEEIRILAGEGVKICLCPGSNRFLQVGRAPVQQYLDAGLLPSLGTDSAASNPELSLWREMALLAADHPHIDPATVFAMATRGGAMALGVDGHLGALAPGYEADMLAVAVPVTIRTPDQLLRYLVTAGTTVHPKRITA
jgi:cytosine/adenosine deaminase-related metal-dependent hydrolase